MDAKKLKREQIRKREFLAFTTITIDTAIARTSISVTGNINTRVNAEIYLN